MSRDYKKEYADYHSKPEQKKNRAKRNKAHRNSNCGPGQEVDHKVPLSAGGSNSPSNWRVVSKETNRKKGTKKMSSLDRLAQAIEEKTAAPEGVERLPSGGIKYRGETFPGYNKPKAAPKGSKHKKRVLAKKGDKVKVVNFGARGYRHNYSAKAKKSYLARSAGIKGKDDKFSANYWSRRNLWPKNQKADGSSKKTAAESTYLGLTPAQLAAAATLAGAAGYGGYQAYNNYSPEEESTSYMPYLGGAGLLAAGVLGRNRLKSLLKARGGAPRTPSPSAVPPPRTAPPPPKVEVPPRPTSAEVPPHIPKTEVPPPMPRAEVPPPMPRAEVPPPSASSLRSEAELSRDLDRLESHMLERMGYTQGEVNDYFRANKLLKNKDFVFDTAKADASAARFAQEQEQVASHMQNVLNSHANYRTYENLKHDPAFLYTWQTKAGMGAPPRPSGSQDALDFLRGFSRGRGEEYANRHLRSYIAQSAPQEGKILSDYLGVYAPGNYVGGFRKFVRDYGYRRAADFERKNTDNMRALYAQAYPEAYKAEWEAAERVYGAAARRDAATAARQAQAQAAKDARAAELGIPEKKLKLYRDMIENLNRGETAGRNAEELEIIKNTAAQFETKFPGIDKLAMQKLAAYLYGQMYPRHKYAAEFDAAKYYASLSPEQREAMQKAVTAKMLPITQEMNSAMEPLSKKLEAAYAPYRKEIEAVQAKYNPMMQEALLSGYRESGASKEYLDYLRKNNADFNYMFKAASADDHFDTSVVSSILKGK